MIRAISFACNLPSKTADALNHESGRIYTEVMVEHYRIYRNHDLWLNNPKMQKYHDRISQSSFLHAHSVDAAQEAFYKACKTAKANRADGAKYPYKKKYYRTTIWKKKGIRKRGGHLLLSLAKGNQPIAFRLPASLAALAGEQFLEVRLVYNKAQRRYEWHVVIETGIEPLSSPGNNVAGIDLGEVHPAAITDGQNAMVVSCRELRSLNQYWNKRLADLKSLQSQKQKHSRSWWRIQRRINRFLAQNKQQRRDMEHKISRAVVDWSVLHQVGTLAIGDVRDVADGKRLNRKSQQKVSNWSHGQVRRYIAYKAEAQGILVNDEIDESYTSQTCVCCGRKRKPKGRIYSCECGQTYHRDVGGAANILSRFCYGELSKVDAPGPFFFRPHSKVSQSVALRSLFGTEQVAREDSREAPPL
jgi:putative transposase